MPQVDGQEVKETVEIRGGESSKPQEKETSPEVKTEEQSVENKQVQQTEVPEDVDVIKAKEQISNLNVALKQEREARKKSEEKLLELESQLKTSSETIERLKSVFSPEEQKMGEEETQYMTKEEAEEFWQQKFEELKSQEEEQKKAETIKQEIAQLEKEFDGSDGKPKYNDEEVLNWQKENNKLYLSPREAFLAMKKDEIIDWEVKQRLSGKKQVAEVEKPSMGESVHKPEENLPTDDKQLHQAVLEAIENAEREL